VKTKVDDEGAPPAARAGARFRGPVPSCFAAAAVLLLSASPAVASENLNLQPDLPVLGGLLIGFAFLILPANQLIFKPIFRALDERKSRIDGARNRARQIERDADNVLADYEARIREARADADQARKEQINAAREEHTVLTLAARSEAERQIDHARQTLAGELASARVATRAGVRDLAQAAAEQILGRSIS
jgi:F-type H+-transporting ATPase subunit b